MEEPRRPQRLDDFARFVQDASRARAEIFSGVSRLRRAMATKLEELRVAEHGAARLADLVARHKSARKRRKPPEAGLAVPAEPLKGPLPMQGGAGAPLDFGD